MDIDRGGGGNHSVFVSMVECLFGRPLVFVGLLFASLQALARANWRCFDMTSDI
jgi:hypothetical protein